MSLNTDHLRRAFVVIDDIHATNKIPSLSDFMVQSRRTGTSAILNINSIGQLTHTYGEEDTNSLLRACDNVVALTSNEPSNQQWLSARLGFKETVETIEVSYGNSDQKIQNQRVLKLPWFLQKTSVSCHQCMGMCVLVANTRQPASIALLGKWPSLNQHLCQKWMDFMAKVKNQ